MMGLMEVKSLYIHYPHCEHLCNYCDFYKSKFKSDSNENFFNYLINSLPTQKEILEKNNFSISDLETIYIGGGTPSLWGKEIIKFLEKFKKYFEINHFSLKEFTIEVDPSRYQEKEILELLKYGVNRLSIGVQSFDKSIFPLLDRSHDFSEIEKTLKFVSSHHENFSVDFMIGLPEVDSERNVKNELERILKFNPKHISLYILSVGESYPLKDYLPDDEKIREEYLTVHEFLSRNNFNHYEVSNYALKGFESNHNWQYWKQNSYLALGPSGSGLLVGDAGYRYKWLPSGEVNVETLSSNQLNLEKLYTMARTNIGIEIDQFSDSAIEIFKDYEREGLGEFQGKRFAFNQYGFVNLDTLIERIL